MIGRESHFRATNKAAYELLREVFAGSVSASYGTVCRFIRYLSEAGGRQCLHAVDLNVLFRFMFVGRHLVIIPKSCFGSRDVLIVKDFLSESALKSERVEFDEDAFAVDSNVYLSGYIRDCMKGASHG